MSYEDGDRTSIHESSSVVNSLNRERTVGQDVLSVPRVLREVEVEAMDAVAKARLYNALEGRI